VSSARRLVLGQVQQVVALAPDKWVRAGLDAFFALDPADAEDALASWRTILERTGLR
jgi:hypothetical protein